MVVTMIKKLCLIFLLMFILIVPVVSAYEVISNAGGGVMSIGNWYMQYPRNNITLSTYHITGKNMTGAWMPNNGVYDYAKSGGTCNNVKFYNYAGSLRNFTFTGNLNFSVDAKNTYAANFTVDLAITSIEMGNLTNVSTGYFVATPLPAACDVVSGASGNWWYSDLGKIYRPDLSYADTSNRFNLGTDITHLVAGYYSPVPPLPLVFSISETGNFTNKLSGVNIILSNGVSGITDINGNATITTSPSSTLTYSLSKSGYVTKPTEVLGGYGLTGGIVYNSLVSGAMSSDYYITVSPAWIPAGGSQYLYGQLRKYGTSSTNLTDIKSISWQWHKWQPNNAPYQVFPYYDVTNNNNWLEYVKQPSGIYNGWSGLTNSMSVVKTAALPNPLSLNPVGQTGTIITELYASDIYGNNYYFNTSNLIGDNTTQNTHTVKIQDSYTGGALLFGFISLKNELTGIWANVSAQTGAYEFVIAPQTPMTIYCNASGYNDRTYIGVISGVNTISYCNMMASGYLGSGDKTQVIVYTRSVPVGSGSSQPISNAYVTITQLNNTISKSDYSSNEGITKFSANISTAYTITASKNGWLSASQTINTAYINPYEVYLYLGNPYTTTLITYTPIPTPTTTQTLIGGGSRNLTAAICGAPTSGMTIVELFKQNIACWGVDERIAQDLVLAGIIIAFFAFVMSKWGKGLGALIGASIGFILSIAAGLIPVWAFFALIIMAGLIFGLKLYGGK